MTIPELKQSIQEDTLNFKYGSKLIFTGEETYLQNTYIKQIAKVTKSKLIFADDYLQIKRRLTTNTMLDKSGVFVIRNSSQFVKNENLFKELIVAEGKTLILIFDKLDKRGVFYKENQENICNFEKMTAVQLTRIIHKTLKDLSTDNCELLCELVQNDYGRLLLELDKLNILKNDNIDDDTLFSKALKEGIIYREITDTTFEIVDNLLAGVVKPSLELLRDLKQIDNDAFKLMGLLYNNYKNMLLLKCNPNININNFIKNKLLNLGKNYTPNFIIKKMKLIQNTEQGIKSGKIDAEMALDYLVINLLFN